MDKKIIALLVENIGWVKADYEPIELFTVNGEMALVNWYRKGNREYNGRYVVEIQYDPN